MVFVSSYVFFRRKYCPLALSDCFVLIRGSLRTGIPKMDKKYRRPDRKKKWLESLPLDQSLDLPP